MNDWNPELPGQDVRIRSNPGQRGLTTGKVRKAGTRLLVQVEFGPNEKTYKPKNLLELCGDDEGIASLLRQKRFGGPDDLRRILTFEKVKGQLTNVFYSMEASQTDFYAHQFKPVLKFLNSPVGRLLIADEVGLGKTIEAMYIWKELQARADARRLLIVCPAMLRQKWQDDLRQRFNIFADIVDANALLQKAETGLGTPQTPPFVCITSLEGLRPGKNWEDESITNSRAKLARLLDANPATDEFGVFDLAIFDEAHYLRNASTASHRIGGLIRDASRHLILLTATPVQIHNENLFQLLRLISPEDFFDLQTFDAMLEANSPIIRALRCLWSHPPQLGQAQVELATAAKSAYLANNSLLQGVTKALSETKQLTKEQRVDLGYKLEKISLLGQYITRSRKRDVLPNRVKRAPQTLAVQFSPLEKEIYNHITTNIEKQTQGKKGVSVFRLIARQRQMASCMVAALTTWQGDGILNELINESLWEDFGLPSGLENDGRGEGEDVLDFPRLKRINLDDLEREDGKYRELRRFLKRELNQNPGEKFVIFAYFRGTLQYLQRRLEVDDIFTSLIMGDMGDEKWNVVKKFKQDNGPAVLLSSEVGSEGIDLQHCRFLVNYDLPWNPMKVEQRIGRLDRLGQKSERISIVNFSLEDTVEERILEQLYERINVFQESIGDLENILGAMTEKLLIELFDPSLTVKEKEQRAEETAMALLKDRTLQDELETEAINMMAFSDHILGSIQNSKDQGRWLQPEEVHAFVNDCFSRHYPGTVIVPNSRNSNLYDITLAEDAKIDFQFFLTQNRCATPTLLSRSGVPVTCFFDPKIAGSMGKRNELLDATHPLILWIRHRYETAEQTLHPVSATRIAPHIIGQHAINLEPGLYVYAAQRWTFEGIKTESQIAYKVGCCSDGILLSDQDSEAVLTTVMQHGQPKANAANFIDDIDHILELHQVCEEALEESFGGAVDEFDIDNQIQCDVQERSARAFAERKQQELEERLLRFRQEGKTQIIPATEGKLRKINRDQQGRLKFIQQKRDEVSFESFPLASGVIFVEA